MQEVMTKVIATERGLTLVEWMDGDTPKRAWITPDMIKESAGRQMLVLHPGGGLPHGEDWSKLISGTISADEIARQLKRSGIWTIEDLQNQPNVALGVIRAVAGDVLQELLSNARTLQKENRT